MSAPRDILFTDVDGTLCFHGELHDIQEISRTDEGVVHVRDPHAGKTIAARDVSVSAYRVYLAESTRRLAHALRERYEIVLVTGGRPATTMNRRPHLDFADAVILENGGMILDADYREVAEWREHLAPQREALPAVAAELARAGWTIDADGRTSALRVRLRDNPGRTPAEFDALCRTIALPPSLKKTINLENLDIILADAGKDRAVGFWMERRGVPPARCVGIGDDHNDLPFLACVGRAFVLAGAFPAAREAAHRHGWALSSRPLFEGIDEILENLLKG